MSTSTNSGLHADAHEPPSGRHRQPGHERYVNRDATSAHRRIIKVPAIPGRTPTATAESTTVPRSSLPIPGQPHFQRRRTAPRMVLRVLRPAPPRHGHHGKTSRPDLHRLSKNPTTCQGHLPTRNPSRRTTASTEASKPRRKESRAGPHEQGP